MIDNGIHQLPATDYHLDPCARPSLSASIAKILITQSPAHAWLRHPRGGKVRGEPNAGMRTGTLIDSLLLGGDAEIVEVDAKDWRTTAAKEARAAAEKDGKVAVLAHAIGAARWAADKIRERIAAAGIALNGTNQATLVWTETAANGESFQARGRLDHLSADHCTIYDLKTTDNANPVGSKMARKMIDFGYDIQAHAYTRAIERLQPELAGRVQFVHIWAETVAPFAVAVTTPASTMRELGSLRWRRAVDLWGESLRSGRWPGYESAAPVPIEAPIWELSAALDGATRVDDPSAEPVADNEPQADPVDPVTDEGLF